MRLPSESRPPGPWLFLLLAAAVFGAALVPFWPSLEHGFVELDDDYNFQNNPYILELSADNLRWMFSSSHVGHYHPLTWLSIALDVQWAGKLSAQQIHRTSLVLHAATSVLAFVLAWQILAAVRATRSDPSRTFLAMGALIAALLFALHPLRVESVVWATERRDVLSGLFLFASLVCWMGWLSKDWRAGRFLAVVLFALSLLSKAWGLSIPAVLLVLDWLLGRPHKLGWRALVLEKLLWFAPLALASAALAAWAQGGASALLPWSEHGLLQRLAQASYGLCFYVQKTLWPAQLSPLIGLERNLDWNRPVYLACMAMVLVSGFALFRLRRAWPAILAAFLAYALIVSPVLGFLQSGAQKVADRYSYLATFPLVLLLGAAIPYLGARARPQVARAAFALGLLLALPLAHASRSQTAVWRDSESLYTRVVDVEPENYFGQHMLSVALWRKGPSFFEQAIEHSKASVRAHPDVGNEAARHWLGVLHRLRGEESLAVEAFQGAVQVVPTYTDPLRALSELALARGDRAGARAPFERALEQHPDYAQGYVELAALLASQGDQAARASLWGRAHAQYPAWSLALAEVGRIELAAGASARAAALLQRAAAAAMVDPQLPVAPWKSKADANDWYAELLCDLGLAQAQEGQADRARAQWELALRFDPNSARARGLLQSAPR